MPLFIAIDWKAIFVPSIDVGEIVVRGTLVYLFLFLVLRVLRREAGTLGISDLLVVVLIADAAQNAMGSAYRSVTEGVVLVMTIAFWDYLFDFLVFRFPLARRLLRPAPLLLIKDGVVQRRNLRKEMITEDELMGQLREQGVEDARDVRKSYMEADGRISVIPKESPPSTRGSRSRS